MDEEGEVPFTVTVPGTTSVGLTQSINHFQTNYEEVTASLGVDSDEVSLVVGKDHV